VGLKAAQLCLNVLQLHARSLRLLSELLFQSSRGGNAMSKLSRQLFTHECWIVKLRYVGMERPDGGRFGLPHGLLADGIAALSFFLAMPRISIANGNANACAA